MTPLPGLRSSRTGSRATATSPCCPTSRRCARSRGSRRPRSCCATCVDEDTGEPVEVSPRRILQRQVERAAGRGYTRERSRRELEFFLFRESLDEAAAKDYADLTPHSLVIEDYHILQTTRDEYLIRAIRNGMDGAGVPVEFSKGEAGRGQHEINLVYSDAVEMADRHVIYKNGAKEIASQLGRVDHVHGEVLVRRGRLVVPRALEPVGRTTARDVADVGRRRARPPVAGVPRLARRPDRVRPRARVDVRARPSTPTSATSPSRGRRPRSRGASTTARAGSASSGTAPSFRLESRIPGADVNPYLAFAATIAAGLHGIEHGIDPAPRFDGNAYAAPDARARAVEPRRSDRRVRDVEGRGRRVRRRRARPPAQHGPAGVGALQPRGHRLGTPPQLRPVVTRDHAARRRHRPPPRAETDKWPYSGATRARLRATSTRSTRAGGTAGHRRRRAGDPKELLDAGRRARAHRRSRRRSRASTARRRHPRRYGVDADGDEFELRARATPRSRGRSRRSRSAAASRSSTSRSAARCTSTSPTTPASRPHGQPGVAGGGRAARRHDRRRLAARRRHGRDDASPRRATTTRRSTSSATACASSAAPPTASSRRSSSTAPSSLLAVQWHPEDTAATDPAQQRLFDALVAQLRYELASFAGIAARSDASSIRRRWWRGARAWGPCRSGCGASRR